MLIPRKAKPRMMPIEAATQRVAYTVGLTLVCSILVYVLSCGGLVLFFGQTTGLHLSMWSVLKTETD